MIDPCVETLIRLGDVGRFVPSGRSGKRLNQATVWRWCLNGARGRVLESVVIGGCRYTSREALTRFCQPQADPAPAPASTIRSPAKRRSDQARAKARLDAAGVK